MTGGSITGGSMTGRRRGLSIFGIAGQNLMHRSVRSGLMIFFVLLLSASLFASSLLMDSMKKGITLTKARMGADVILVSKEYGEELRAALFTGKPCTMYLDRGWVEKASGIEGASRVSSQLYIATLGSGCCDVLSQLIAFDPETDFVVRPWLERTKKDLQLKTGEIVIGSKLYAEPGDTLTFYDTPFTVAAKMEETGMSYDSSVFMSYDTARLMTGSEAAKKNLKLENFDQLTSMVLIQAEDGKKPEDVARNFSFLYYQEPVAAVTANSLVSDAARNIDQFSAYSKLLIGLLLIMTIMALVTIFTITINERKYEFGILCSIGATRGQMVGIIVLEALLISTVGGLLGTVLAWGGVFLFQDMLRLRLEVPYLEVSFGTCLPIAVRCLLAAFFTGLCASAYSAFRISREEPHGLISENEA